MRDPSPGGVGAQGGASHTTWCPLRAGASQGAWGRLSIAVPPASSTGGDAAPPKRSTDCDAVRLDRRRRPSTVATTPLELRSGRTASTRPHRATRSEDVSRARLRVPACACRTGRMPWSPGAPRTRDRDPSSPFLSSYPGTGARPSSGFVGVRGRRSQSSRRLVRCRGPPRSRGRTRRNRRESQLWRPGSDRDQTVGKS